MPPRFHLKTTRPNISEEMLPPLLLIPASLSPPPPPLSVPVRRK